ncbi:uncharacterized protein LOC132271095 isoform X2 [Cornus florida]|uniref:uncharacterized protein LOC132271095 isoform X2 n=1 Tax=Cornus florida TaxID=4283 RepID=UPI0028997FD7|nr:uncharacterized protein LOC132271095 isoform X2 [Cornus florida]
MKILSSLFPIFSNPNLHPFSFKFHTSKLLATRPLKTLRVSINPPPPDFDFKSEIFSVSRASIAQTHPDLLDLADNGSLVLIRKSQFGPVPVWRTQSGFVEPEAIWLIGTTHISDESADQVERLVRAVKPDSVVVELCRSRAGIMYTSNDADSSQQLRSNMFSLSGTGFFGAVNRSINLGGQTALALRLLLAVFSSKISSDVNRPFGDELERAWNSLTWNDKFSLVISVLRGISSSSDLSKSKLKESSSDDGNFQLYKQLSFSYPSLLQPLIVERDTYLAWSLKWCKAVNKSNTVVGVIGKAHMNGVIYALVSDLGDLRFRDLAGKKPMDGSDSWVDTLLKNLVRDTIIGILLWLLFEQAKSIVL